MRPIIVALLITLAALQYKLWFGDGSIPQWISFEHELRERELENQKLAAKNMELEANIIEMKHNEQALEEQARYELGMIRKGETYYQFSK